MKKMKLLIYIGEKHICVMDKRSKDRIIYSLSASSRVSLNGEPLKDLSLAKQWSDVDLTLDPINPDLALIVNIIKK